MQYIKINEVTNMSFYQTPKVLFVGAYKNMKLGSKMVYSFLRDRVGLSIKNNWVDKDGNVFIYYSRDNLAEDLNISEKSVRNYMKELAKYDLIKEKRQGLTKPNKIYVGTPVDTENTKESKIYRSGGENNTATVGEKLPTNYTEFNNTNFNNKDKEHRVHSRKLSFQEYKNTILEVGTDINMDAVKSMNYFTHYRNKLFDEIKYDYDTWNELFNGWLDVEVNGYNTEITYEDSVEMIKKFFNTQFEGNEKGECDYSPILYCNDKVKEMKFYDAGLY